MGDLIILVSIICYAAAFLLLGIEIVHEDDDDNGYGQ